MDSPHRVVVSVPFWRVVGLMAVACIAMVVGAVWIPEGLVDAGLLDHDAAGLVVVGALIGGLVLIIGGFLWAATRAGADGVPQIPGTVLATVEVSTEGYAVDGAVVAWGEVAEVVVVDGRPDGMATSATPHHIEGAAIRRQSGVVLVVHSDGAVRALSPVSREAGAAIAAELVAALEASRSA
jgi:hypothetical protein